MKVKGPQAASPREGVGKGAALLQYYGGRVITNVQVVPVLWGPNVDPKITPGLQGFYEAATNSSWFSWLTEYNSVGAPVVGGGMGTNQTIGNGTAQAPVVITPSFMGTTIDDTNVQAELSAQIAAGNLPAPTKDAAGNTNTIYPVFFPHGDTITLGGSASCQVFCAYHGTIAAAGMTPEFYYAVQPDFGPGSGCDLGCGSQPKEFDNVTMVASHELAEATTDAEVGIAGAIGAPLAWYDTANGEIGDICNQQTDQLPGTPYYIQKLWSNQAGACITDKGGGGPQGTVAGTVTSGGKPVVAANLQFTGPASVVSITDGTGHYSQLMPAGTYTETVSAFGLLTVTIKNVTVTAMMTTTEDVTMMPAPNHALSGTVTDSAGNPQAGATVTILGTPIKPVTTDAMGKYTFAAVPDATYKVSASGSPCLAAVTQSVTLSGADTTADFKLPQRVDAYGYSCKNTTYNYVDAGTVTTITGNSIGAVPLPFEFTLYGVSYTTAYVSTNGFVSFDAKATASPNNTAIPNPAEPNAAVYGFWAGLNIDAMASIRTQLSGTSPNQTFTIEWRNAVLQANPAVRVSFEVVLGQDGSITMQYQSTGGDPLGQGGAATIGLEDAAGAVAFQYSFDQAVVSDKSAVVYTLPPEGIVRGTVTDKNDGTAISGAQVQALQGATVVRSTTTDTMGHYQVQVPVGSYTIQVTATGYSTGTASVNVAANAIIVQDFALTSPLAVVTPTSLEYIMEKDQTRTRVVTLTNAGSADLKWQIKEAGGGVVASAAIVPETSGLRHNPLADPNSNTTKGLYLGGEASGFLKTTSPGKVLASFSAGTLGIPFGAGFTGNVWLSDAIGVLNQEYTTSGMLGRQYPASWAGAWPGDMAFDSTHNLMCQVNVGGDNGIYCWDVASGTVKGKITGAFPWTGTSQRGLAYRPDDDSFYIGGWNEGIVYHVKGLGAADAGTVIGKCNPPDPNISGLAWNGSANILWEATNSSTDTIYEINPDTCTVISSLPHPNPGFHGGGIEIDDTGNLWTISQSPQMAYLLESDVPTFGDVPWLDESPKSGTLKPGQSVKIGVVVNTFGLDPAVYSASLFFLSNSAKDPSIRVPVSLVVTTYRQGVNAGGDDYTDSNGDLWSADQALTGMNTWGYLLDHGTASTTGKIAGTPDPELFRTQRIDPYAYKFTGLPPGVYQLELGFAELNAKHAIDTRLFDVIVKEELVIPALDITYEVGNLTADWHSFTFLVTDGVLDVRLVPIGSKEPPVINALRATLRPDLK